MLFVLRDLVALTGISRFVVLLTFWILSSLQDCARMKARTFVKCAAVWFTMFLALRPARATFVTSNEPGCAAIMHSPLLSFQHVNTPAPVLIMDWSDVTQNFKPKRKKKRGSRGGGSK